MKTSRNETDCRYGRRTLTAFIVATVLFLAVPAIAYMGVPAIRPMDRRPPTGADPAIVRARVTDKVMIARPRITGTSEATAASREAITEHRKKCRITTAGP